MSSGFKKRLTRLHASRQRLRQPDRERDGDEPRVFFAEDIPNSKTLRRDFEPSAPSKSDDISSKWARVGAKTHKSARGDAYYLHQEHPHESPHGRWRLGEGRAIEIAQFRDKFPALFQGEQARGLADLAPHRLAFVDLETNGLSKKSYPFCIGIGLWEPTSSGETDIFSVYHFLMRTPDDEPAALSACVEMLQKADGLCTFNGASFDVPMLKRRCEHHRIKHPFDSLPHLDLLRFSRKIYAQRKSHKLSRLEVDLLNIERVDDVPGAQIPRLWNRYLESKNPASLLGIFEHNRIDILSMVVLICEFSHALSPKKKQLPRAANAPKVAAKNTAKNVAQTTTSGINQSLARSYALRKNSPEAQKSGTTTKSTSLVPSFSRAELSRGLPVGGRLRSLRAEVEDALQHSRDPQLAPRQLARLHEMLALAPRHPFALEKIVDHYRQTSQPELARHFEKRLQDISPF